MLLSATSSLRTGRDAWVVSMTYSKCVHSWKLSNSQETGASPQFLVTVSTQWHHSVHLTAGQRWSACLSGLVGSAVITNGYQSQSVGKCTFDHFGTRNLFQKQLASAKRLIWLAALDAGILGSKKMKQSSLLTNPIQVAVTLICDTKDEKDVRFVEETTTLWRFWIHTLGPCSKTFWVLV